MSEELQIIGAMIGEICAGRDCKDCRMDLHNNKFNLNKSLCIIESLRLSDKMMEYIEDYYHELKPDGKLTLKAKPINISAAEIINMLGD